jgi:hypothetical protein
MGTGADLNITSSGTHTTNIDISHTHDNTTTQVYTGYETVTVNGNTTGLSLNDPGHGHGWDAARGVFRTKSVGETNTATGNLFPNAASHTHSISTSGAHRHEIRQEAGSGGTQVTAAANIISLVGSTASAYRNDNNTYTDGAHSHTPSTVDTNHWHIIDANSSGVQLRWTVNNVVHLTEQSHTHTTVSHRHTIPNFTLSTTTKSDTSGLHVHAKEHFAGRIGLVTGGVDGNSPTAMVTGPTNPPFIALRHIIKL